MITPEEKRALSAHFFLVVCERINAAEIEVAGNKNAHRITLLIVEGRGIDM